MGRQGNMGEKKTDLEITQLGETLATTRLTALLMETISATNNGKASIFQEIGEKGDSGKTNKWFVSSVSTRVNIEMCLLEKTLVTSWHIALISLLRLLRPLLFFLSCPLDLLCFCQQFVDTES